MLKVKCLQSLNHICIYDWCCVSCSFHTYNVRGGRDFPYGDCRARKARPTSRPLIKTCGEGGIRTLEPFGWRFSRPLHSTTMRPLLNLLGGCRTFVITEFHATSPNNLFFKKALPDPVFRYFSNLNAVFWSSKAK